MRIARETVVDHIVVGRSITDNTIYAREPQLLNPSIPLPPIPIISPLVGDGSSPTGTNTLLPAQTTPSSNGSGNGNNGKDNAVIGSTSTGGDGGTTSSGTGTGSGSSAGSGSGLTPPPGGAGGGSPTIGDGTTPPGSVGGPSPSAGSVLASGAGGTPTTSNFLSSPGNSGSGTSNPSSDPLGAVANAGVASIGGPSNGSPALSSKTFGAGSTSSSAPGGNGSNAATSGHRHLSAGAVVAIVVIFFSVFLFLLAFFLRRHSKARRDQQAHLWWFSKKRTSQTYGDGNSAEILASGVRSARSSFATTFDHSLFAGLTSKIPPIPPMAEVGRANATALPVLLDPSHSNDKVPDNRFSLNSSDSENSQYLFVNIRNSLQNLIPKPGEAFSPSEIFAFPKPPSPIVKRASRHSTSTGTVAGTIRTPNSDDSYFPALPNVFLSPAAETLTGADPFTANPFSDSNPFDDHHTLASQAITRTTFSEREVIRHPFQSNPQDEITVIPANLSAF